MNTIYTVLVITFVVLFVLHYMNTPLNTDNICQKREKYSRQYILKIAMFAILVGGVIYYFYNRNDTQSADLYGYGKGTQACDICEKYAGTSVKQLQQWGTSAKSVGNLYKNACVKCAEDCLQHLTDVDKMYKLTGKSNWLTEKQKIKTSCSKILSQAERAKDIVSQL
jgi:hypothetical protein